MQRNYCRVNNATFANGRSRRELSSREREENVVPLINDRIKMRRNKFLKGISNINRIGNYAIHKGAVDVMVLCDYATLLCESIVHFQRQRKWNAQVIVIKLQPTNQLLNHVFDFVSTSTCAPEHLFEPKGEHFEFSRQLQLLMRMDHCNGSPYSLHIQMTTDSLGTGHTKLFAQIRS